MKKVLVITQQEQVREFIFQVLHRGGYMAVDQMSPDVAVVVLDSELTGQDGFQLCQSIRQDHEGLPILMLTGRGQNVDMLTGLMTGADDYLMKPFSSAALIAHVKVLVNYVRREAISPEELLSSGPFLLNTRRHTLEKLEQTIRLTAAEYETLKLLMQDVNQEVSKEEILSAVWGTEANARQVDMTIRSLRAKLEEDPTQPAYIITVRGRGYKWCG